MSDCNTYLIDEIIDHGNANIVEFFGEKKKLEELKRLHFYI